MLAAASARGRPRRGPSRLTLAAVGRRGRPRPPRRSSSASAPSAGCCSRSPRAARDGVAARRSRAAARARAVAARRDRRGARRRWRARSRTPEALANQLGVPAARPRRSASSSALAQRPRARRCRRELRALVDAAARAGELEPRAIRPRPPARVQVTYNGSLVSWAIEPDGRSRTACARTSSSTLSGMAGEGILRSAGWNPQKPARGCAAIAAGRPTSRSRSTTRASTRSTPRPASAPSRSTSCRRPSCSAWSACTTSRTSAFTTAASSRSRTAGSG